MKKDTNKWWKKEGISLDFWRYTIRPLMIKKYGGCQKCGTQDNLRIHHTDYNNQTINTLQLLCLSCHIRTHKS